MAAPGVTVIKTFTYRGAAEEFSNTYHFVGTAPSTPADWRTLVDSLIDEEKLVFPSSVTIVRALCYEDTSHDSVYTYHLADFGGEVPGTLSPGSGAVECPGDDAVWAAWDTGRRNSKSKPIWLRKYYHPAFRSSTDADTVSSGQHSALISLANTLAVTFDAWPGIADPEGNAPTGGKRVSEFVTTRTLKRRGRRPT